MGRIISYSKAQTTVTLKAVLTKTASGAHTYTAVSLGAASADRYIAVCVGYISSATPATVTIGGVSAANVASVVNSDSRK